MVTSKCFINALDQPNPK